jgi:hypothetical protein
MTIQAEISRANPTCLLLLVDQSGSMQDPFGADEAARPKAQGVADAVNRLLQNLVIKCTKSEGVRDYLHVGVIGYGAQVGPAFGGSLAERTLAPISAVAERPARIEERAKKVDDGAGGLLTQTVKFPVWFDPVAAGGTPMCQALGLAARTLAEWLAAHPACFPPIVINITDGESTDGDPSVAAAGVRELRSDAGHVLLFNVHISSQRAAPIEFPSAAEGLPDQYAGLLFSMSSPLPEAMRLAAQAEGYRAAEGARGFVFNADIVAVIRFLDIGTRLDLR